MCLWTDKKCKKNADDDGFLSSAPSREIIKAWLAGVGIALIPLVYGIHCLIAGHTHLFGRRHGHLDLDGSAAVSLAIAYIAIGAFFHFHWFWGLHSRLESYSNPFKIFAAIIFLVSLGFTIYKALIS